MKVRIDLDFSAQPRHERILRVFDVELTPGPDLLRRFQQLAEERRSAYRSAFESAYRRLDEAIASRSDDQLREMAAKKRPLRVNE